jgi:hypothetical protein
MSPASDRVAVASGGMPRTVFIARAALAIAVFAITTLGVSSSVRACTIAWEDGEPNPERLFDSASTLFRGTVVQRISLPTAEAPTGARWIVEVDEVWKGTVYSTQTVVKSVELSSCGANLPDAGTWFFITSELMTGPPRGDQAGDPDFYFAEAGDVVSETWAFSEEGVIESYARRNFKPSLPLPGASPSAAAAVPRPERRTNPAVFVGLGAVVIAGASLLVRPWWRRVRPSRSV